MLENDIAEAVASAQIALSATAVRGLAAHLSMVLAVNATMNITAVTDPQLAVWAHVVDSLLGLPEVLGAPAGRMADLGSGAGYPGVPLAIATCRQVTLVESVKKKARFLESVVERLELDAEVKGERAESLAAQELCGFTVVTARAVSSLPSLVELAAPLLAEGGVLVAYKGSPSPEEVARGDRVAESIGMGPAAVRETVLPGPDPATRTLVSYVRTSTGKIRLPRRPGMAQRHPLA